MDGTITAADSHQVFHQKQRTKVLPLSQDPHPCVCCGLMRTSTSQPQYFFFYCRHDSKPPRVIYTHTHTRASADVSRCDSDKCNITQELCVTHCQ